MVAISSDPAGDSASLPSPDFAQAIGLVRRLAALRRSHRRYDFEVDLRGLHQLDLDAANLDPAQPMGRARKVSVSIPEELIVALQQRLAKGEFSQYVTEAVAHRLQRDLLVELDAALEVEFGPIPEEFLAQARAEWPDAQ